MSTKGSKWLQVYECIRCNHKWVPRKLEKPKRCPKCKNPWDKPSRMVLRELTKLNNSK